MNGVFDNIESYPLERRILIITTSAAVLLCTASAILNYYFELHYGLYIIPIISATVFLILFNRSLQTESVGQIAKAFIITCVIALTFVWFLNDGYNSSHSLLIFNAVMISIMISGKNQRLFVFVIFLVALSSSIIIQYYYPQTIVHYKSEGSRFGDILLSTAYNLLILYYLLNYVLNNYEIERQRVIYERKRSDTYNQKLKEKNKQISNHIVELDELNKRLNEVNYQITRQNIELDTLNQNQKKLNSDIVHKNHVLESLNNELNQSNSTKDKLIKRINKELDIASKYVMSLIPKPITNGKIRTDWVYIPSVGLGGDAFGYSRLDRDNFASYLIDVSGHGVGAALHSVQVLNILQHRTLPHVDFTKPDEVLNSLNKIFKMDLYSGLYFTLCYAVYNIPTSTLRYAGAGHPPLIIVNDSGINLLESQNIFIGAVDSLKYNYDEIKVEETSSLYIFSDGVFELEKPNKEMFTFNEFQEILLKYHSKTDSELLYLYKDAQTICGKDFLEDDYSLLKIRIG